MNDRYDRRSNPEHRDYGSRQAQQWDQTPSQAGDTNEYSDYRLSTRYGDGVSGDRQQRRELPPVGQQRDRGYTPRSTIESDYRDERGYGNFTGSSYGGRDYAYRQDPAYGSGYTAGSYGAGTGYSRGYDNDRGFFERAGDEIASWFGDDDAARRREKDHRGAGPQNYARSDQRILDDICDRLTDDSYVDASDITVTVQEREVTLDGTVTSRQAKRRAEDVADNVTGVGHVQNNLRVKDRQSGDTRTNI